MGRVAGVVLLIFTGIGCGDELASGSADPDADMDTDTGETATTAETGPTSGGTTGLTTDSTFGTSGSTWPSSGTDDEDPAAPPRDDIVCGVGGFCEDGEDGPVCTCDAGFVSSGLDCLPCQAIDPGMLPAEVPTARAAFEFMLDGQPSAESGLEFGRITLHNRSSGDVVRVGDTNESPPS